MTNIEERIAIAASPERMWGILADPAAAASYVPGIKAARMEGNTRICTMADGAEIRERIFDIAPAERSYRYEHTGTPMPVRLSRGRFHVASDGKWRLDRLDRCGTGGDGLGHGNRARQYDARWPPGNAGKYQEACRGRTIGRVKRRRAILSPSAQAEVDFAPRLAPVHQRFAATAMRRFMRRTIGISVDSTTKPSGTIQKPRTGRKPTTPPRTSRTPMPISNHPIAWQVDRLVAETKP